MVSRLGVWWGRSPLFLSFNSPVRGDTRGLPRAPERGREEQLLRPRSRPGARPRAPVPGRSPGGGFARSARARADCDPALAACGARRGGAGRSSRTRGTRAAAPGRGRPPPPRRRPDLPASHVASTFRCLCRGALSRTRFSDLTGSENTLRKGKGLVGCLVTDYATASRSGSGGRPAPRPAAALVLFAAGVRGERRRRAPRGPRGERPANGHGFPRLRLRERSLRVARPGDS